MTATGTRAGSARDGPGGSVADASVVGALAFAIATWWSVVTPIIAILMLTIGSGNRARYAPFFRAEINTVTRTRSLSANVSPGARRSA